MTVWPGSRVRFHFPIADDQFLAHQASFYPLSATGRISVLQLRYFRLNWRSG